ncbi:hypothetical protein BJV78DRAFT_1230985 [Lactifluus subvellereus]|nr:hypothetical protein BJV78DRAFT_1230985 [Lactifluus subvellereus]
MNPYPSPDRSSCYNGTLQGEGHARISQDPYQILLQITQPPSSPESSLDIPVPSGSLQNGRDDFPTALTPASSAPSTVISFDSLYSAQANLVLGPEDESHTQPPGSTESMNTSALPSSKPASPYVQHKRFFLDDGNITFLVEGILYRVHRYFFCRDSNEFGERLSRLSTQQAPSSTLEPIISLDDVKSADFDTFLSVLYPLDFNMLEKRSFEEWSSILDLSTRWGFTSIRDLAIRCVKPPSAYHRLLLARKHAVDQWILPALSELWERPQPLSVDEARLMDFEDIVLIGSVRESVRSHTHSVHPAESKDCIEASKKGVLCNLVEGVPCDSVEGVPCDSVKGVPCDSVEGVPCDSVKGVPCDSVEVVLCDLVEKCPVGDDSDEWDWPELSSGNPGYDPNLDSDWCST